MKFLQRVCAGNVDVPIVRLMFNLSNLLLPYCFVNCLHTREAHTMSCVQGQVVYTGMLNDRGGFESDVTVTRVGESYIDVSLQYSYCF